MTRNDASFAVFFAVVGINVIALAVAVVAKEPVNHHTDAPAEVTEFYLAPGFYCDDILPSVGDSLVWRVKKATVNSVSIIVEGCFEVHHD